MQTHAKPIALAILLAVGTSAGAAPEMTTKDLVPAPDQATPPAEPDKRPAPQEAAQPIVLESVRDIAPEGTNADAATAPASKPEGAAQAGEKVSEKTRNEIRAMLVDEVQQVKNVVIIDLAPVHADQKPAVSSSELATPDQPHGQYRIYPGIKPELVKGKVALTLQILRAGHSADAADMAKPIAAKDFEIDPANVRAAQKQIHAFLASKLTMSNGHADEAKPRPQVSMWVEVKNADGSQDVRENSKLVIYYKANRSVYMNLYLVNDKNEVQRLVPGKTLADNFTMQDRIYRYPPTGEGLTVIGSGTDKIRAVYTLIPSGVGADLGTGGQMSSKGAPIGVIPTQYPAVFTNSELSRFFSLPADTWNENEISYTIKK